MSTQVIRLGTRGSQLAMWQSTWVAQQLESRGLAVELIRIQTDGDVQTGPLAQIGGQGLFTKRLQQALLDNEIDLAVHSLKDLPTHTDPRLTIAAVPTRECPFDSLVSNQARCLDDLPERAIVGTGSVRRIAQLKYIRPDLDIRDIRGNIDTRISKLDAGEFDAIVLASAGLLRLSLADRIAYQFQVEEMAPAVGQGALGLETRRDDGVTRQSLEPLNDPVSFCQVSAERSLLQTLQAGCLAPVAAWTEIEGDQLSLTGFVLSPDGRTKIESRQTLPASHSMELGNQVGQQLKEQGAEEFLKR
ncbi:MAG: hydroxymethylbilane synthase [Mariniblastus sp.]|nr:hydroxymethylbilane synthase [Mariniblastus sp.]